MRPPEGKSPAHAGPGQIEKLGAHPFEVDAPLDEQAGAFP